MIKINLAQNVKSKRMPVILGLDLAEINLKAILLVILISLLPDFLFKDEWNKQIKIMDRDMQALNQQIKDLEKESKNSLDVQKQIDLLNSQERELSEKLDVVKKIIKIKRNPMQILLYMAKNIPDDLWLTGVALEEDSMVIQGNATSYKSIGLFVENLRNSVFFGRNPQLSQSRTIEDTVTGKKTEFFEVRAKITRFE